MHDPEITAGPLREAVVKRYGVPSSSVRVIRSPYRICPLGAHTDHQLGSVTSMAIDRGVLFAYAPSASDAMRVSSFDFSGEVRFSLADIPDRREGDWGNFVRGAARALAQDHPIKEGFVGITSGRLDGGGLSSSAAIGVAFLLALEEVNGLNLSVKENIGLHQRIENEYLGLRIGILDQSAILLAQRDHLTAIDCATQEHRQVPYPTTPLPFTILIAFSGIRQALVETDYNRRVVECREAAALLLQAAGRASEVPVLGNLHAEEYATHRHHLHGALARRAKHFFSEAEHVKQGIGAWQQGRITDFGKLISAAGQSSISNYECGSPPLIDLYHLLVESEGVLGARFSGAGFRGCCLALVTPERAEEVAQKVPRAYARKHPEFADGARAILCASEDGARFVDE